MAEAQRGRLQRRAERWLTRGAERSGRSRSGARVVLRCAALCALCCEPSECCSMSVAQICSEEPRAPSCEERRPTDTSTTAEGQRAQRGGARGRRRARREQGAQHSPVALCTALLRAAQARWHSVLDATRSDINKRSTHSKQTQDHHP